MRVRRILRHRLVKFGGLGAGSIVVAGLGAALLIAHGSALEESLPQEAASTLVTVEPARAEQTPSESPEQLAGAPVAEPAESPILAEDALSATPPELASADAPEADAPDMSPATASGALAAVAGAAEPPQDTETVSALRGTNVAAFAPDTPTAAIETETPGDISLPMQVALRPEPAPSPKAAAQHPDKQERQAKPASGGSGKLQSVRQSVTLRSGPGKSAAAIGTIPAGTQVEVVRCEGWCEIVHQGRRGFIYKSFLP